MELEGDKYRLFISYSRGDSEYVTKLRDLFTSQGHRVILDQEDIVPGEPWRERLSNLILEADLVIFVVTGRSISSEMCAWELDQFLKLGKRIIPLIHRLPVADLPRHLNQLHWVDFTDEDLESSPSENRLKELNAALDLESIKWTRQLTSWLLRAQAWSNAPEENAVGKLLSFDESIEAQAWLDLSPPKFSGSISSELIKFFRVSAERSARERTKIEAVFAGEAIRLCLNHKPHAGRDLIEKLSISSDRWPMQLASAMAGRCAEKVDSNNVFELQLSMVEIDALNASSLDGNIVATVGEYEVSWRAGGGQTGPAGASIKATNSGKNSSILQIATGFAGEFEYVWPIEAGERVAVKLTSGMDSIGNQYNYCENGETYLIDLPRIVPVDASQLQQVHITQVGSGFLSVVLIDSDQHRRLGGLIRFDHASYQPSLTHIPPNASPALHVEDIGHCELKELEQLCLVPYNKQFVIFGIKSVNGLVVMERSDNVVQERKVSDNIILNCWTSDYEIVPEIQACSPQVTIFSADPGRLLVYRGHSDNLQELGSLQINWLTSIVKYALSDDGGLFFLRTAGKHHDEVRLWRTANCELIGSVGGVYITEEVTTEIDLLLSLPEGTDIIYLSETEDSILVSQRSGALSYYNLATPDSPVWTTYASEIISVEGRQSNFRVSDKHQLLHLANCIFDSSTGEQLLQLDRAIVIDPTWRSCFVPCSSAVGYSEISVREIRVNGV